MAKSATTAKKKTPASKPSTSKKKTPAAKKTPASKPSTSKPSTSKKKTPAAKTKVLSFPPSERTIYDVPLNIIVNNPGNPGGFRDQEVIPALYEQGYRTFPTEGVADDHTLWTMLNGKPGKQPDEALRQQAVHLIGEFESRPDQDDGGIVELAGSLEEVTLLHPIHLVVQKGKVGIESGMVRSLAASYSDARNNQPAGTIAAEIVSVDGDLKEMLARAASENIHFVANQPMALAHRYRLMREGGMSVTEIAKRINRNEQTVRNYLDLTDHPENVQQAIANGSMTMQLALDMCRQARDEDRPLEEIVAEILGGDDDDHEDDSEAGGGGLGGGRRRRTAGSSTRKKPLPWQKIFLLYVEETKGSLDRAVLEKLGKDALIDNLLAMKKHFLELFTQIMQVEPEEAEHLVAKHLAEDNEDEDEFNLDDLDLGV